MTVFTAICIAAAGGLGAAARFLVGRFVDARSQTVLPIATMLINVSGSLALGVVAGLAISGDVGDSALAIVGTGFLGGYTTFSTTSVETVRLIQRGRAGRALVNVTATLALALAAVSVGLMLSTFS